MVGLLGVLCKARNNLRATGLGHSREGDCQWWHPSLRQPVIIPGPLAQTPFNSFSLTAGKHRPSLVHCALSPLQPHPQGCPCAGFWSSFAHLLAALLCPGVSFPSRFGLCSCLFWSERSYSPSPQSVQFSFKMPVKRHLHTPFPDLPGQRTSSQTCTEYAPCAEHFIGVILRSAHNSSGGRRYPHVYRGWSQVFRSYLPETPAYHDKALCLASMLCCHLGPQSLCLGCGGALMTSCHCWFKYFSPVGLWTLGRSGSHPLHLNTHLIKYGTRLSFINERSEK